MRLLASLLVCLAFPAGASASVVTLHLRPGKVTRWTGSRVFPRANPIVRVFLPPGYVSDLGNCAGWFYGHGQAIRYNVCGLRLRLRATALTRGSFHLDYRVLG